MMKDLHSSWPLASFIHLYEPLRRKYVFKPAPSVKLGFDLEWMREIGTSMLCSLEERGKEQKLETTGSE
jgi:hypothetical protein